MSIRHLVRKIDQDLVARVLAGTAGPKVPHKLGEGKYAPRAASTYRAARRNALRRAKAAHV